MSEAETETAYKQQFMSRVAQARAVNGWTQAEMAEALGMPQDKYKQYEGRSLLPHHLFQRFCLVARVDLLWLVTGQGKMRPKAPEIVPDEAKPAPRAKRAKGKDVA